MPLLGALELRGVGAVVGGDVGFGDRWRLVGAAGRAHHVGALVALTDVPLGESRVCQRPLELGADGNRATTSATAASTAALSGLRPASMASW